MKIIKRSGEEVDFNKSNIYNAISKANQQVDISRRLTDYQVNEIVTSVVDQVKKETHTVNVEDVQDFVEKELMKSKKFDVMHGYITYRYEQTNKRQKNTTDDRILSLLCNKNEEVNQENANKNPMIASTQRDYMAGEVSKDLTRRFLLSADIWKAHEEGLIHFHDTDYFASPIHNCDLVNLEDMLQNGTVISGTKIDKPHKFSTACNIATQIIAQVASSQYGGQTISLAHLSPFVEESRNKFYKDEIKDRSGEELTEPGSEGNETLDDGSMTVVEVYAKHGNKDIYKLNLKYDDNYIVSIEKEKDTDIYKMTTMQVDYESTMFAVEKETADDIRDGVQTIQYQIITLMTTNGQAPFVSIGMYLNEAKTPEAKHDLALVIEEVLKQRILGVKNSKGIYIAPSFPKLLYVLEEDNINENGEFYYLTKLAAECTSKRMVPDYISEKKMLEYKIDKNGNGHAYPCMGCRSFLTPYVHDVTYSEDDGLVIDDNKSVKEFYKSFGQNDDEVGSIILKKNEHKYFIMTRDGVVNKLYKKNGKIYVDCSEAKYYGRFNQGVVTINLIDIALSSQKDYDKFWKIYDERLELCHRALQIRHSRLMEVKSDVAPILWQNGALARLQPGEKIEKLLFDGYSTISLGYAGLYECVYYMTGKSHTDPLAKPFALKVMQKLNDACAMWKKAEKMDYSVYGTPIESTTYKFAKCLQRRFGVIKEVTDHNYITNSYHINVREPINAFDKLTIESEFQKLSPGGAISYVEAGDLKKNIESILAIIKHIYDTIMYAEINERNLDTCEKCGFQGEIPMKQDENGKLYWECPQCGNKDHNTLTVVRRVCGYLSNANDMNQGRMGDIGERVLHI